MGNSPSSHPHHSAHNHNQNHNHHHPSRSLPTSSAPATPTGGTHPNPHLASSSSSSASSSAHAYHLSSPPAPPPTSTFVDGGYLFPISNIYPSSSQDWLHPVVQNLILTRRLAPFYRGLEDWEPDWDSQTISHSLQSIHFSRINSINQILKLERQHSSDQAVPSFHHKSSTAASIGKRFTKNLLDHPSQPYSSLHHHHPQSADHPTPNARQQIFDAVINAHVRPNEVNRYLNHTVECPICFLYYPPNINLSRCCQQPICTECFTQIKRIDPTPQEIKSDPACCPYCVEANFGVTYEPPPPHKRTDWSSTQSTSTSSDTTAATLSVPVQPLPTTSSNSSPSQNSISSQSAPSSSTIIPSLHPDHQPRDPDLTETVSPKMKRRQTTSHTSKQVVTTDSIQPDWQAKLEAVKAAVQRRANRRIIFRQEGDRLIPVGITSSRDPSGSAFLAAFEHDHSGSSSVGRRTLSSLIGGVGGVGGPHTSSQSATTPGGSLRRHRGDNSTYGVDLEELMIMEAMRLSLAEEEDRKRKAAEEDEKLKRITEAMTDVCQGSSSSTNATPSTQSILPTTLKETDSSTPASTSTTTPLQSHPSSQLPAESSFSTSRPTSTPAPGSRFNPLLSSTINQSTLSSSLPPSHLFQESNPRLVTLSPDGRPMHDPTICDSPQTIAIPPNLSSNHSDPSLNSSSDHHSSNEQPSSTQKPSSFSSPSPSPSFFHSNPSSSGHHHHHPSHAQNPTSFFPLPLPLLHQSDHSTGIEEPRAEDRSMDSARSTEGLEPEFDPQSIHHSPTNANGDDHPLELVPLSSSTTPTLTTNLTIPHHPRNPSDLIDLSPQE